MVTHYSTNGLDSACGRNSATLNASANSADVSCKSCQRSLGKGDSPAPALKKSAPSLADLRKPKTVPAVVPTALAVAAKPASQGYSAKAAWQQRLDALGSACRLPRGKAKQRFV